MKREQVERLDELEGRIEDVEAYLDDDGGTTNMDNIPAHCRPGLKRYIERGIKPGKFLRAVLCNDLLVAVRYADAENLKALSAYGLFLLRHAPTACYGSKAKYDAWIEQSDDPVPTEDVCPTCRGSGEGGYSGSVCRDCKGSGEISAPPQDEDDYEHEPCC